MTKLARGSLRMRRTMLERMMVMMVKQRTRMCPLLRLQFRVLHPLHRLQHNMIEWKLLLRGRSSLGERHPSMYKLIIRPQESSETSMNA
jgi:hypothetical protein